MTRNNDSPATKGDILAVNACLREVNSSVSTLSERMVGLDVRQDNSEKLLEKLDRSINGDGGVANPGNGGRIGIRREVDGNTRFKRRCVYWLKWLAGIVSGLLLTSLGIVIAYAFGKF